jgi:endonuclease YncB( thermonuclease family)
MPQLSHVDKTIDVPDNLWLQLGLSDNSFPIYSLNGIWTVGKVVDVYDGDTCTINLLIDGSIKKLKCRCMGYDCAEMKPSRTDPRREEIKAKAKKAREYFCNLIGYPSQTHIMVECLEFDKYGRLLVNLYNNDTKVNDEMIRSGNGYSYKGGTKNIDKAIGEYGQ